MSFSITSTAFHNGDRIPIKHTCDGQDISPAIEWANVPQGTKSFALIVDDPDAPIGTWVHWVIFNLPVDTYQLQEGILSQKVLSNGAKQGISDFKRIGYGGPCPPKGAPHRYFFKLYALDKMLDLEPGCTKKDVEKAMKNHIVAETQIIGTYSR